VVDAADALQLSSDTLLYDVRDVHIDGKNQVWVLSEIPPFVHVFYRNGALRSVFGLQGQGPGELRMPWNFVSDGHSSEYVAVWDGAARRLIRFSDAGAYLGSVPIEIESGPVLLSFRSYSFGEPVRVERGHGGYVVDTYDGQITRAMDLWRGRLVFLDENGQPTGTTAVFADLLEAIPSSREEQIFRSVPLWSACPDGTTHILNPDSARVRTIGVDGKTTDYPIRIPTQPLTEDDIRRYVTLRLALIAREERVDTSSADVKRAVESTVRDLKAQLPRNGPPVRLRCDAASRLWIELFATDWDARGYSGKWLVVSGSQRHVVRFPPRFHALHFGHELVAGFVVNDLGVETPAVFPYPPPLATR
jgi:hypothetical protein